MLRQKKVSSCFAALVALVPCLATAQTVDWSPLSPTVPLPQRAAMASAYDPVSTKLIVFGGFDATAYSSETWAFDGVTWALLTPPTSPSARAAASMAFDSVTQTIVLFGGFNGNKYLGDTWTFDGATTTWSKQSPSISPKGVTGPMVFPDPLNGHATLYGGFDGAFYQFKTYQWTGTDWTKLNPASTPSARSSSLVALDPAHGNVVLFGGLGSVNPDNTWLWDGTNWSLQSPLAQPPLRYDSAAAFDPHLGAVVAFGGGSGGSDLNDTWMWDGSNWRKLQPSAAPAARESFAMAYDAAIDQVVVAGGWDNKTFQTDTWAFHYEGQFLSIGPGIGGTLGAPTLDGTGDLTPASAAGFTITIGNALANDPTFLLASVSQAAIPFKGGFLYPFPIQVIVPLLTDVTGGATIASAIPAGVPSGTTIFVQAWMLDPSAPKGMGGTNGLEAIVP